MARKSAKPAEPKRFCRVARATVYASAVVANGNAEVTLVCDSTTGAELAKLAATNIQIVEIVVGKDDVIKLAKPAKAAPKRSPKPKPAASTPLDNLLWVRPKPKPVA